MASRDVSFASVAFVALMTDAPLRFEIRDANINWADEGDSTPRVDLTCNVAALCTRPWITILTSACPARR